MGSDAGAIPPTRSGVIEDEGDGLAGRSAADSGARRRVTAHDRLDRQITGDLSMQTSFGNGNGNGNGNGQRIVGLGLGLGLGHRPADHTRLDLRGRQLPPHPESHPRRSASGGVGADLGRAPRRQGSHQTMSGATRPSSRRCFRIRRPRTWVAWVNIWLMRLSLTPKILPISFKVMPS